MLVGKGWKVRVPGVVKNVLHHYMIWFLKSCSAKYLRLFGTIISRWSLQHVCTRYCTYAISTVQNLLVNIGINCDRINTYIHQ